MKQLIKKIDVCEILADMYPFDGANVVPIKKIHEAYVKVLDLPCVHPEQNVANWVGIDEYPHEDWECNNCGRTIGLSSSELNPYDVYKYCPSCGFRMLEEGDENDLV